VNSLNLDPDPGLGKTHDQLRRAATAILWQVKWHQKNQSNTQPYDFEVYNYNYSASSKENNF
jgi:hypothetical protein